MNRLKEAEKDHSAYVSKAGPGKEGGPLLGGHEPECRQWEGGKRDSPYELREIAIEDIEAAGERMGGQL